MTFVDNLLQHATIAGTGASGRSGRRRPSFGARGDVIALLTLLWAIAGCGAAKGTPAPNDRTAEVNGHIAHVRAQVDVTRGRFDVTMCFPRPGVRSLRLSSKASSRLLEIGWLRTSAPALRMDERTGRVGLGTYREGACLRYLVAVPVPAAGQTLLLKRLDWLLAPLPMSGAQTVSVELDVRDAKGHALTASTPWPKGHQGAFVVDAMSFRHLARTVFGEFARYEARAGEVELDIVRLPGALSVDDAALRRWLVEAVGALGTLDAAPFVPRVQFLVVPVPAGDDPVPFGSVGRGGQPCIMLLVRENATLDALRRDWVAVHELSHLAMPFIQRGDAWLSEGLATYYQEVLRARAGMQSELAAWRALDEGFARGRQDGTSRRLSDESRDVFQTFAFRRVYWSGAALALMFDVALRRHAHSVPTGSLDRMMRAVVLGHGSPQSVFSADAFFDGASRTLGADLLAELAQPVLEGSSFPELDTLYDFLGVERMEGRLVLNDEAPGASIRRAIMSTP